MRTRVDVFFHYLLEQSRLSRPANASTMSWHVGFSDYCFWYKAPGDPDKKPMVVGAKEKNKADTGDAQLLAYLGMYIQSPTHQSEKTFDHSYSNGVYPERKKMGKRSNIYGFATDPYRGGLFAAGHRANDQLLPGEELEENMRPVYSNNKILIT